MREKVITVVIPLFNSSAVFLDALNSALIQDEVYEVICVDDGSTDSTCELLSKVKDTRVRVIRQSNKGPASARNTGARAASTKYIAFLDADDYFLPRRFETVIQRMESDECCISISSILVITMRNRFIKNFDKSKFKRFGCWYRRLSIYSQLLIMNTPTIVVRKTLYERVNGFDERLSLREDHKFLIDCTKFSKIYIDEGSPVVRRLYDKSFSSNAKLESVMDGSKSMLSFSDPSFIERLASDLSTFHVCYRKFGLLATLKANPIFGLYLLLYPTYLVFRYV